jgi:hypothetical protein
LLGWRLLVKEGAGSTTGRSMIQLLNGGGGMAGGPVHTSFECRVGMAGRPVQEEKGRPGGPVQNISDVGGGGGGGEGGICSKVQ